MGTSGLRLRVHRAERQRARRGSRRRRSAPALPDFTTWLATVRADGAGGGGDPNQRWRRYSTYSLEHFVAGPDGRELVDDVLRLEDIDSELRPYLATTFGLGHLTEVDVPTVNRSTTADAGYADHYDSPSRELVADRYRRDIGRFGYRFDDEA